MPVEKINGVTRLISIYLFIRVLFKIHVRWANGAKVYIHVLFFLIFITIKLKFYS